MQEGMNGGPGPGSNDPRGGEPGHNNTTASSQPAGMRLLERVVSLVQQKNGSDIHLLEGEPPRVRIQGDLLPLDVKDHPVVTRRDIEDILDFALTPDQRHTLEQKADIDFSLDFQEATGRINVGYANGRRLYFAMRYLRANIIPIDELGIDADMLRKLAATDSGMIMIAGETSSGKTTTIAAMLDYINHNRLGSISTIENPVEYTIHSRKCLISRREIGRDTPDFHSALRASVRKNPDVLLIGEIRDEETADIALTSAETGIQTFCTIHAIGAVPAISRLGHIMISGGQNETEFYLRFANVIRGIIAQQLVKAADGKGVIPGFEILNMTYAEKNYLRERDFTRLEQSLEADHNISLGGCVYRLWHKEPRRINEDTVKRLFGDQFKLMMNRLGDHSGWKPLATGI